MVYQLKKEIVVGYFRFIIHFLLWDDIPQRGFKVDSTLVLLTGLAWNTNVKSIEKYFKCTYLVSASEIHQNYPFHVLKWHHQWYVIARIALSKFHTKGKAIPNNSWKKIDQNNFLGYLLWDKQVDVRSLLILYNLHNTTLLSNLQS